MSGAQLTLAAVETGDEIELVDAELVSSAGPVALASALSPSRRVPPALDERNLFGEAQRIAARAASATTRRQYGAIFRAFGDWLASELGRPPVVGDLDADVIAAYGRHLATCGGRGGRPAAPATVRVYMSMVRALARDLGLDAAAEDVRVPRHEPGPPETLTDTDYGNLLRVPDRRTIAGKRDYALLRVLGDCGLRSAELRGLRARDLRRPRPTPATTACTCAARAVASVRSRCPRQSSRRSRPGSRCIRSPAGSGCSTSSRCSCASAATAMKSLSRSPPSRCTGSCAATATPPGCPSGWRTRTRSGPTGPPTCSRPASPSTRSPRGSGTSTCGPPLATPPRGPSASMRSPRCSIAATTRRGGRVGGRRND